MPARTDFKAGHLLPFVSVDIRLGKVFQRGSKVPRSSEHAPEFIDISPDLTRKAGHDSGQAPTVFAITHDGRTLTDAGNPSPSLPPSSLPPVGPRDKYPVKGQLCVRGRGRAEARPIETGETVRRRDRGDVGSGSYYNKVGYRLLLIQQCVKYSGSERLFDAERTGNTNPEGQIGLMHGKQGICGEQQGQERHRKPRRYH
ncbi:hypothetical protein MYCTH_2106582 [Thermothelomyces thermophilus ATCC 42464]|uniref:Uncharacterized protein n=1 Tax=Thermothelomyces thermophilus (strain ATCC 42464 / BCRC 31852 / DSM 1799) TaxID=573729 RepID=G2Q5F3_THET4|nr:uncharacterized protein MYCTH_2106582 [Thermothelomyces thermophilus ATCC 42464]AEO53784.1 hypothetical protein MYCTH_2106582 [Thermothelomyces thermophilus ATCC 42464]